MSGPPPLPTRLKVLRGNPGKQRLNANEPVPAPTTADPPADLSKPAVKIWASLAPELVRLGILTSVDRDEFALACRLRAVGLAHLTRAHGKVNPAYYASLKALAQSSKIFARYGIGAADRSRISTSGPATPQSKWRGLLPDSTAALRSAP